MELHVTIVVRLPCKTLGADRALKRLLARVNTFMELECRFLREVLVAIAALIPAHQKDAFAKTHHKQLIVDLRLLANMLHLVRLQLRIRQKLFRTVHTRLWIIAL